MRAVRQCAPASCDRGAADETLDVLPKIVDGAPGPAARNTLQTHNHRNHERFDRPAAAVLTPDAPQHQDAATERGAQAGAARSMDPGTVTVDHEASGVCDSSRTPVFDSVVSGFPPSLRFRLRAKRYGVTTTKLEERSRVGLARRSAKRGGGERTSDQQSRERQPPGFTFRVVPQIGHHTGHGLDDIRR